MQCKQCGKSIGKRNASGLCRSCSSREMIKALHKRAKGKKLSKEHCERIRVAKLAENNPMWRGESVGMHQLHTWVKSRIPKPKKCECCKEVPPYDLANKGIYDRNLKNWEWLCRKCHMTKDGRIKKLASFSSENAIKMNKRRWG